MSDRPIPGELVPGGANGGEPPLERRVSIIEATLSHINSVLIRLDERTAYLATKEDLAAVRAEMSHLATKEDLAAVRAETARMATKEDLALVRAELATKASRGTVWTAAGTMVALVVASAAFGAIYVPYVATLFRRVGQ